MRGSDAVWRMLAGLRLFSDEPSAEPIAQLASTDTLSLVDHGLTGLSGAQLALSQATGAFLVNIDLSHNALGDRGAVALFKGLGNKRHQLRELKMASCSITDVGLLSLIQHLLLPDLPSLPNLRKLMLNNNGIHLEGLAASLLASALSHKSSQLRLLCLTSNEVGGNLTGLLRNLSPRYLQTLQLNNCGLTDDDGRAIFEWLLDPQHPVTRLEMCANRLTGDTMSLFTDRLRETGLASIELLANSASAPIWPPAAEGYNPPYINRWTAHSLQQEALRLLPVARIVSQAKSSPSKQPSAFAILRLPFELRQRIVLMTGIEELGPPRRSSLGTFLSQRQYGRLWTYAADRSTLIKALRLTSSNARSQLQHEEHIIEAKEAFLTEVGCFKPEKGPFAGDN